MAVQVKCGALERWGVLWLDGGLECVAVGWGNSLWLLVIGGTGGATVGPDCGWAKHRSWHFDTRHDTM